MADRKKIINQLTSLMKEGKISDAYRAYEELPFVDQIIVAVAPGIGDALAGYEIKEFSSRAAKNVEDKDYLGATGNFAIASLAGISLIPLFRWLRGTKGAAKAATEIATPRRGKAGLKGPGEYQAEQAAKKEAAEKAAEEKLIKASKKAAKEAEAAKKAELPVVEEFKPLSLDEMVYPGTLESGIKNLGLTSKTAKFINTSKKLPVQGKLITYINALEKAGIPKGELRLLKILDESNEIHPKLLKEIKSRNPLDKITRQRLSQYIKASQQGAISKRIVGKNKHSRQIKELGDEFANIKENTFHVRGITRKQFDHYPDEPHKDHFVFDSTSEFKLPNIPETEKITEFIGGDNFLNVARVQSDYAEEMGQLAVRNKENQLERIFDDESIDALSNSMGDEMRSFAVKIARKNPQITSPLKLREVFIKEAKDEGVIKTSGIYVPENIDVEFPLSTFSTIQRVVKSAQKEFPLTPYVDGKAVAVLKKSMDAYNEAIPTINKLSVDEFNLQKKIENLQKETGLTADSPSIADELVKLDQIKKTKGDLITSKVAANVDEFTGFTLSPKELTDATGKTFEESLDKSLDQIFYDFKTIDERTGAIQQTFTGTPLERATEYFNQMVNNNQMTFDIGNGVRILKEATQINAERLKGYPIDPYAKGTRTNYMKLPIRSNFLKAVEEGKDGMYFDSAAKRLGKEGGEGSELLQGVFREGESEIDKIIRELGVDPKDYVLKPKDIEFKGPGYKFDGTYVKIDDEIRKLVQEKGVDAFKAGGPVNIQDQLNELNKAILPIDTSSDVGSIIPNDFNSLLKETGMTPVGSEGVESIILAMSIRAMNPLQKAQAIRASTAPVLKKLKSLHEQKQKYVENNSATQVNKYAERLNRYNRDIQLAEDKIKDISKMYDPKNYNAGGPVSIDNMLAAL